MDKIQALKVFVAVAKANSFSIAADRLEISAPMVSRYIAWLEKSISSRLFHRTTRRLSLTEAGADYLRRTTRILEELEQADSAVAQGDEVQGVLRITTATSFGQNQLIPVVNAFMKKHPKVQIELMLDNRRVNMIDEGYDLAVRIAHEIEPGLVAKKLCICRTFICASPSYLKQHGTPKSLDELNAHESILFPAFHWQTWQFKNNQNEIEHADVQGRLQINNIDAIAQAAMDGLGLAHLPTFLAGPLIREGKLKVVTIADYSFVPPSIFIVYPTRHYLPPKVRAFITALTEWVSPEPVWDREV